MKDRLMVSVLAVGGATVAVGLYLALWAMLNGGTVVADFNGYYEGWLEVGLLAVTLVLYPFAIGGVIRDRTGRGNQR